ncbi:MAG: HAD family hydrolase [Candidatus Lokiarchaeota archaeon]|nr:HAD family hydrolase [Candidatus Lokiarchaeota archaeon]
MSTIKGIIFDLDGVIYDVGPSIRKAVQDGVEKYKMKVDLDNALQEVAHLLEDVQNYPLPQIILNSYTLLKDASFFKGLSYFKKMRIVVFLFNQFNEYRKSAKLFEGIDGLLSSLSKKVKLAVLTNNKSTYAEEILDKYNISKYFDVIIGFNDVNENKPSPEGILKILNKWNVKNNNAVFIGDMTSDILAGKAANVKVVSVATGLAKKNALVELNPDVLIDEPKELKTVFNI